MEQEANIWDIRTGLYDWLEFQALADRNQHQSLPIDVLYNLGKGDSSYGG